MVSSGAAWTTRPGLRWFVRGSAILVGLASMVGVVVWWIGGLYGLGGVGESSLREAVPYVIAAVAAGLLTSEIVLRAFDLPGRDFWHRYGVVVVSVCIGGAIEGGLLGWVFSLDGTLFPEPPPGLYAGDPLGLLGDLAWALLAGGSVGAVMGLVAGLAAGLVLGVPLAKLLGALSDEG
jgi:hypothetical protein